MTFLNNNKSQLQQHCHLSYLLLHTEKNEWKLEIKLIIKSI